MAMATVMNFMQKWTWLNRIYTAMAFYAIVRGMLPSPLLRLVDKQIHRFWEALQMKTGNRRRRLDKVEIPDRYYRPGTASRSYGSSNALFHDAEVYLRSIASTLDNQDSLKVSIPRRRRQQLVFHLPEHQKLEDSYQGVKVWWTLDKQKAADGSDKQRFVVEFEQRHAAMVKTEYLSHVTNVAQEADQSKQQRYLYRNGGGTTRRRHGRLWVDAVPFTLVTSFENLAVVDAGLAANIAADLAAFKAAEVDYHRAGRAWKRGYLLSGVAGSGKASLIAAMSHFLNYDIYDLQLASVYDNVHLKSLLLHTTRKSIVVIHADDIPRRDTASVGPAVTLSGLLNFTDGLHSSCSEERIFVLCTTASQKQLNRLDPALIRPGRFDMHIHLPGLCSFTLFKQLAACYLGLQSHPLFSDIELAIAELCRCRREDDDEVGQCCGADPLTPLAVAEILNCHRNDPDCALAHVLSDARTAAVSAS